MSSQAASSYLRSGMVSDSERVKNVDDADDAEKKAKQKAQKENDIKLLKVIAEANKGYQEVNKDANFVAQNLDEIKSSVETIEHSRILPDRELIELFASKGFEDFFKHFSDIEEKEKQVFEFRNRNMALLVELKKEGMAIERSVREREINKSMLKDKIQTGEDRAKLLERKCVTGNLVWKVPNILSKLTDDANLMHHSHPAFCAAQGPKFRISIHAAPSHLVVIVSFMRSPLDDVLKWPLRKTVQLTLLDPNKASRPIVKKYHFTLDKIPEDVRSVNVVEAKTFALLQDVYDRSIEDVIFLHCKISSLF